jgi:predicted nucleic acid-binding Zn ribbon protein
LRLELRAQHQGRGETQRPRVKFVDPHAMRVPDYRGEDPSDFEYHIEVLFGAQPYSAATEDIDPDKPCPVCKGAIPPGARVYCAVCHDCGLMKNAEPRRRTNRAA